MLDLKSPRHTSTLPNREELGTEHISSVLTPIDGVIGRQLVDS